LKKLECSKRLRKASKRGMDCKRGWHFCGGVTSSIPLSLPPLLMPSYRRWDDAERLRLLRLCNGELARIKQRDRTVEIEHHRDTEATVRRDRLLRGNFRSAMRRQDQLKARAAPVDEWAGKGEGSGAA